MTVFEMLRASSPRASAEVASYMTLHPPELAQSMSVGEAGLMAAVAHSGNVDLCGLRWAHSYSRPIAVVMKALKSEAITGQLGKGAGSRIPGSGGRCGRAASGLALAAAHGGSPFREGRPSTGAGAWREKIRRFYMHPKPRESADA